MCSSSVFEPQTAYFCFSLAAGHGESNPPSPDGSVTTTSSVLEAWVQTERLPAAILSCAMMSILQRYILFNDLVLQIDHCDVNKDIYMQHVLSELFTSLV